MNKPIKILMLNYEFPPLGGGAANATKYIINELAKNNQIQIDLVTSSIDKFKIEKYSNNTCIHFLDIGKNNNNLHYQTSKDLVNYSIKAFFYAKKLTKITDYDLIHAFFGIPCGFLARFLGLPYIVCLRGSDVPFYSDRFRMLDKFLFRHLSKYIWKKSGKVIANSHNLKELAQISAPNQSINVIYNGVDFSGFVDGPHFQKIRNDDQKKLRLISTGRLIQRKGYEYLIKAISNMRNVELNLIGDGNLKEHLMLIADQYHANVIFHGQQDHHKIGAFLQKSDVFVLPSLNEGMSNSLLEAMAAGLPIITTDTGDSGKIINGNGFIVECRSVDDLKSKIQFYSKNREIMLLHGKRSQKLSKRMSWYNVSNQFLKIYSEI